MKKFVVLVMFISLILTGCGKVASSVQELGSTDTYVEQPAAGTESVESFIHGLSQVFGAQLSTLATEGQTQSATVAQTSFGFTGSAEQGFSTMAINYEDAYPYWMYQLTNKNTGLVQENIEGKYRYYDLRTGLPFNISANAFTQEDVNNFAYAERVEKAIGYYAQYPTKPVYQTFYHEKVTYTSTKATVALFPGKTSTLKYFGTAELGVTITSLNITYDLPLKANGVGYIEGNDGYYSFKMNLVINNGETHGTANVYIDSALIASIYFPGGSQTVETKYYIGSGFYYNTITTGATGLVAGLEDNAILELQNNQSPKYPGVTIDGSTSVIKFGTKLKNLTITSKAFQRARFNDTVTLKNIDGLVLKDIDFKKNNLVIDSSCTNVVKIGITE